MRPKSPTLCWLTLVAVVTLVTGAWAADGPPLEDRVRAAFLFNFTHFVVWQDSARVDTGAIVVAVEGRNGVEEVLRQMTAGELVGGAQVRVIRPSPTHLDQCHILYLGGARDRETVVRWLGSAPPSGVLTVGDSPDFLRLGGIIRFYKAGGRIRFEVSLENARKAGIQLSSKLIQVSQSGGDPDP